MRTVLLCFALCAAATLVGCLDNHTGPRDQYYNTDAYAWPEVGTATDAGTDGGGITCGDGPSFGTPVKVSDEAITDAGPEQVAAEVTMAAGDAGARFVGYDDRSLGANLADVRVVAVAAGAAPQAPLTVPRPAECDALRQPTLAMTGAGTLVVAAGCTVGPEDAPTGSGIVVSRLTADATSFDQAQLVVTCQPDTQRCDHPSLAAVEGGPLYLAWTERELTDGGVTGGHVRSQLSEDDGLTFSGDLIVPDSYALAEKPRLAAGPGGALHLAYTGYAALNGPSYASYSVLDQSGSFATSQNLGPGQDADIAAGADGTYVVWVAGTYLLEAHAVGGGFTPPLPIDTSLHAQGVIPPAIGIAPDGSVHVFWLALLAGTWTPYYTLSSDQAASWHVPIAVSAPFDGDSTGARPAHLLSAVDLAVDATGVTLGWAECGTTEPSTGTASVYLAERVCP